MQNAIIKKEKENHFITQGIESLFIKGTGNIE